MDGDSVAALRDFVTRARGKRPAYHPLCGSEPDRGDQRTEVRAMPPASNQLAGFASISSSVLPSSMAEFPIWFAALLAVPCQARANGRDRAVLWDCVADRALYTNHGADLETIEPFGVQLQGGQTVAVSWQPGESAYRVEVFPRFDYTA